ncbi:MAG: phosphopyruvate hydratase [Nautiliaceae bacterium]|jgi:cell division protein FtsB
MRKIDFDDIFPARRFDKKVILIILAAVMVGVYMVNLMIGKRSFSRLIDLENDYAKLQERVILLKKENEKLQKEYFELKELEGE